MLGRPRWKLFTMPGHVAIDSKIESNPRHSVEPKGEFSRSRGHQHRGHRNHGPEFYRVEAQGLRLSFRPLAPLAQDEECRRTGGKARSRGGLGKGSLAMSVAPESGRNRIMIYGPKNDGTYVVEFKTADGEALAISVPVGETRVLKHFQERMPYGLFVPDVP